MNIESFLSFEAQIFQPSDEIRAIVQTEIERSNLIRKRITHQTKKGKTVKRKKKSVLKTNEKYSQENSESVSSDETSTGSSESSELKSTITKSFPGTVSEYVIKWLKLLDPRKFDSKKAYFDYLNDDSTYPAEKIIAGFLKVVIKSLNENEFSNLKFFLVYYDQNYKAKIKNGKHLKAVYDNCVKNIGGEVFGLCLLAFIEIGIEAQQYWISNFEGREILKKIINPKDMKEIFMKKHFPNLWRNRTFKNLEFDENLEDQTHEDSQNFWDLLGPNNNDNFEYNFGFSDHERNGIEVYNEFEGVKSANPYCFRYDF